MAPDGADEGRDHGQTSTFVGMSCGVSCAATVLPDAIAAADMTVSYEGSHGVLGGWPITALHLFTGVSGVLAVDGGG